MATSKNHKSKETEGQLSIDVYDTKDQIIIVAPIAGTTMKQLKISVTDEVLTISGTRKFPTNINQDLFLTKECFWGKFSRSIVLPSNVDHKKIEATFKNSILQVYIPKTEDIRTQVIKIKSSS